MGRKTKITKEMIMEAAFELLEEGGIGAVAIKSIAAKLGCSTQPVSWQFGSMVELKKALYYYAGQKLYSIMPEKMAGRDALEAFFVSGVCYISIACDHPRTFRFLNVDDPLETIGEDIIGDTSIFSMPFDREATKMLAEEYKTSPENVDVAVRDSVIYTHGLAVMMMFDKFRLPKDVACKMVFDMGIKLLSDVGIDAGERDYEQIMKSI